MEDSVYEDTLAITQRSQRHLDRGDGYVPWGTGLVERAKDLASRAIGQLQEWAKEDPDTWTDDLLRLTGGGIKNVGNTMADWERRSEEGEWGLRSATGTALRFMNWSSEQGARLGRTGARALGVNEELGGFLGSFLPEAIGTKGLSKAAQVARSAKQIQRLNKAGYAIDVGRVAVGGGFGAAPITKASRALKMTDKQHKALRQLSKSGRVIPDKKLYKKGSFFPSAPGEAGIKWKQEAYAHLIKNIDEPNPMRGFRNFVTDDGRVLRATPGSSKTGGLTALDTAKKKKSVAKRGSKADAWKSELENELIKIGRIDMYDEFEEIIRTGNLKQSKRRTKWNKNLKEKGITNARDQWTIAHQGALDKGWPDVPENRWQLMKRHLNSAAGAHSDPPSLNLRMSGVPRDMGEWVTKRLLGESLDITAGLPASVKNKIKNAFNKKTGQPDIEKIDEILADYWASVDGK